MTFAIFFPTKFLSKLTRNRKLYFVSDEESSRELSLTHKNCLQIVRKYSIYQNLHLFFTFLKKLSFPWKFFFEFLSFYNRVATFSRELSIRNCVHLIGIGFLLYIFARFPLSQRKINTLFYANRLFMMIRNRIFFWSPSNFPWSTRVFSNKES